jgi:hypothetical protein
MALKSMSKSDPIKSSRIIKEWYEAMDVMSVHVPAIATTMLHSILDEYEIYPSTQDVWQQFLRLDIDDVAVFYASLSEEDKSIIDRNRANAWRETRTASRELIKG